MGLKKQVPGQKALRFPDLELEKQRVRACERAALMRKRHLGGCFTETQKQALKAKCGEPNPEAKCVPWLGNRKRIFQGVSAAQAAWMISHDKPWPRDEEGVPFTFVQDCPLGADCMNGDHIRPLSRSQLRSERSSEQRLHKQKEAKRARDRRYIRERRDRFGRGELTREELDEFSRNVDPVDDWDGKECVEWTGPYTVIDDSHEPRPTFGPIRAATLAKILWDGKPRPPGMEAAHTCQNRKCVNPLHIEWMTPEEHHNYDNGRDNGILPEEDEEYIDDAPF